MAPKRGANGAKKPSAQDSALFRIDGDPDAEKFKDFSCLSVQHLTSTHTTVDENTQEPSPDKKAMPSWHETPAAKDWSNMPPEEVWDYSKPEDIKKMGALLEKNDHPPTVQALNNFSTRPSLLPVTRLNNFGSVTSCALFCDTVVPLVMRETMLLLVRDFSFDQSIALWKKGGANIWGSEQYAGLDCPATPGRANFDRMMGNIKSNIIIHKSSATPATVRPGAILKLLQESVLLRTMLTRVLNDCPVPTFIPVVNGDIDPLSTEPLTLNYEGTVLLNCCQLLLFAPATLTPGEAVNIDRNDLGSRRYPTANDPVNVRNGADYQPLTLGGHTFEDIHRVVVLGTFAAHRRKFAVTKTHILNPRAPLAKTSAGDENQWYGYIDPVRYRVNLLRLERDTDNTTSRYTEEFLRSRRQLLQLVHERIEGPVSMAAERVTEYDPSEAIFEDDVLADDDPQDITEDQSWEFWESVVEASSGTNPTQALNDFFNSKDINALAPVTTSCLEEILLRSRQNFANIDQDGLQLLNENTAIDFSSLVEESLTRQYLAQSMQHPTVQKMLQQATVDNARLERHIRDQFILDRLIHGEGSKVDAARVAAQLAKIGVQGDWHEWEPFGPDAPVRFRDVQKVSALQVFELINSPLRGAILGTQPGLGKTGTGLLTLEIVVQRKVRNRVRAAFKLLKLGRMEEALASQLVRTTDLHIETVEGDEDLGDIEERIHLDTDERTIIQATPEELSSVNMPTFCPQLVVVPLQVLRGWVDDFEKLVHGWRLYVYYGIPGSAPVKAKYVVRKSELPGLMAELASRPHDPATGRTIILTSYTTLYARMFHKNSHLIKDVQVEGESAREAAERLRQLHIAPPSGQPAEPSQTQEGEETVVQSARRIKVKAAQKKKTQRKNFTRVYSANFDASKWTRVETPAEATHRLITFDFMDEAMGDWAFDTMLLDEGHVIRNPASATYQSFSLIKSQSFVSITGTPLYSRPSDIRGTLKMIWTRMGLDISMSDLPAKGQIGLYHPLYDPTVEENELEIGGQVVSTAGLFFGRNRDDQGEGMKWMMDDWEGRRGRS